MLERRPVPNSIKLELWTKRGAPLVALGLDGQKGDAEVVFAGDAIGTTVVTKHEIDEGGRTQRYLVVLGRVASIEPGLERGAKRAAGTPLARAGDALHLEIRRVQENAKLDALNAANLDDGAISVLTDPRNVLPVR